VDREIDSAECGANRHSKYECPVTCAYSPYHTDNYNQLLELETQLDKAILDQANHHPYFGIRLSSLFSDPGPDEFVLAGKILKLLHLDRDEKGKSLFEDWEEKGFPKLKNDTQVLLSHKRSMRVSLIEIQQVVDEQTITFIDLLENEPRLYKAIDKGMTARACRFQTMIAYFYQVPGFSRFHASAKELPTFVQHTGLEAFTAVVKHLDGETSQEWLLANMDTLCDALDASHSAQHRKRLLISDIRSQELTYKLNVPVERAAALLRTHSRSLVENPLDDESRMDGFTHTFDYQVKSADAPGAAIRVLGTIKLKEGLANLFSINSDGMPPIRGAFEKALGKKAEFQQELIEDISKQIAETMPEVDASSVPPSFLEFDGGLSIESSAKNSPPVFSQGAIDKNQYLENYYRDLLEQPIPALDNASPKQASEDVILRPKLVNWVKELIRSTDRSNLFMGESVDLDWMFDELGLADIRVPAPPPRTKPDVSFDEDFEPEDYEPDDFDDLQIEKYIEKMHQFLNELNSRDGGHIRMTASGCNFMDVLHAELEEDLSPKVRGLLDFFVPAIWFAFDLEGKFLQVNPDTLNDEFDVLMLDLEDMTNEGAPARAESLLDLCMNEEMFMATSDLVEVYQIEASAADKLSNTEMADLMFHLIAVSNVLTSEKSAF
jgi:hypothetical protein